MKDLEVFIPSVHFKLGPTRHILHILCPSTEPHPNHPPIPPHTSALMSSAVRQSSAETREASISSLNCSSVAAAPCSTSQSHPVSYDDNNDGLNVR